MTKKNRVFIDDDSGEPKCLVGDLDNPEQAEKNIRSYVQVALDELLIFPGESRTLTITTKEMTDAEVEALPEM